MSNIENTDQTITNVPGIDEAVERDDEIMAAYDSCGIHDLTDGRVDRYERHFGYSSLERNKGGVDDDFDMSHAGVAQMGHQEKKRLNQIFRINWELNTMILLAGTSPYKIDLDLIQTKVDLLEWARHLCEQPWMDSSLLAEFVDRVAFIKRWDELFDRMNKRHFRKFYQGDNGVVPVTLWDS
jgi:hypothetical protein